MLPRYMCYSSPYSQSNRIRCSCRPGIFLITKIRINTMYVGSWARIALAILSATISYLKKDACLTHWGRETHVCVGKLTIIASDNGLSLGRRQAIIWTNAEILLITPLGTNFNEILIEIHIFSFKIMYLKMSGKCQPFCLSLKVLNNEEACKNPLRNPEKNTSCISYH